MSGCKSTRREHRDTDKVFIVLDTDKVFIVLDTDKVFIVPDDELQIDFRDGAVTLGPARTFVVPNAIAHTQFAANKVRLTLIMLRGGRNTGGAGSDHSRRSDG